MTYKTYQSNGLALEARIYMENEVWHISNAKSIKGWR